MFETIKIFFNFFNYKNNKYKDYDTEKMKEIENVRKGYNNSGKIISNLDIKINLEEYYLQLFRIAINHRFTKYIDGFNNFWFNVKKSFEERFKNKIKNYNFYLYDSNNLYIWKEAFINVEIKSIKE